MFDFSISTSIQDADGIVPVVAVAPAQPAVVVPARAHTKPSRVVRPPDVRYFSCGRSPVIRLPAGTDLKGYRYGKAYEAKIDSHGRLVYKGKFYKTLSAAAMAAQGILAGDFSGNGSGTFFWTVRYPDTKVWVDLKMDGAHRRNPAVQRQTDACRTSL